MGSDLTLSERIEDPRFEGAQSIKDANENENLNFIQYFKNGQLNGPYKEWDKNGNLIKQKYYIEGKEI